MNLSIYLKILETVDEIIVVRSILLPIFKRQKISEPKNRFKKLVSKAQRRLATPNNPNIHLGFLI
jgi:hypothetical protein